MKKSHLALWALALCASAHVVYAQTVKSPEELLRDLRLPQTEITQTETAPRATAKKIIDHVSGARLSLGVQENNLALKHISRAEQLNNNLQKAADDIVKQQDITPTRQQSFFYDEKFGEYYFPASTEVVEWPELSWGPLWSEANGVVIDNVYLVYLTLALNNKDIAEKLQNARMALQRHNRSEADKELKALVNEAVALEKIDSLPLTKAHDNITLAQIYLGFNDKETAKLALAKAEEGLTSAKTDERYVASQPSIETLEKAVQLYQKEGELLASPRSEKTFASWRRNIRKITKTRS